MISLQTECGYTSCTFDLGGGVAYSRTRGGVLTAVETGTAIWRARYETKPLTNAERDAWRGWAAGLRQSLGPFRGVTVLHRRPLRHRAGGAPGSGLCTVGSVSGASAVLTGVAAGTVLSQGDFVAVGDPSFRTLHIITRTPTENGTSRGIEVSPAIRSDQVGDEVILNSPWAAMMIEPGTFSAATGVGRAPVTFDAIQVLR